MAQPFNEHDALDADWLGGPDDTDATLLSDKIVTAAKLHPHCHTCHGEIAKGERHRAITEVNNEERKVMTFRVCAKCCRAMAHTLRDYYFTDCDRAIISRIKIGDARRMESYQNDR